MTNNDPWLNVPQAIVLGVTGDLELVLNLIADDTALLVLKANELVARRTVIPLAADADPERRAEAFRKLQEAKMGNKEEGRYAELERQLHRRLIAGVRTKGSRTPGGAYENIDPVEYTRAELQWVDAVDKRTGKIILFDLRINCTDLIKSLAETLATPAGSASSHAYGRQPQPRLQKIEKWDHVGDPVPKLIDWVRTNWGNDAQELPNRDELLRAFRGQFGRVLGINQKTMREVRRQAASREARHGGAPMHRRPRVAGN
jgi:hypothetical protein